ncbi:hypothetical protein DEJ21_06005 [Curtobacterium sp. MCSS17_006]|nr:hypothetical protein DEJ21_06005 [Curtobacterium sp. MCSS17_006]
MILAASTEAANAAAPFWSAMLTVIPVLALAMSVEVGRQLRNAEVLPWWLRVVQSIFLAGYAAALLVSFNMTLDALVHRDGMERASIVGALVWSSLLFLVALPVWDVLQRVNPEVTEVLLRVAPWSRWRRMRRKLRKALVEVRRTQAGIDRSVEDTRTALAEMERKLADAQETRARWPGLRALHDSRPSTPEAEAEWAEVLRLADNLGLDRLAPGTALGAMERLVHGMQASLSEQVQLQRKVAVLVRQVELRVRGARILRFSGQEKTDFAAQIRSVQTEVAQQQRQ